MNKQKNRKGYIAIEAVIGGALVLSVGLFALVSFSTNGTSTMSSLTDGLDGLLGGGTSTDVKPGGGETTQLSDFQFEYLGDSYGIVAYLSETNKNPVIPSAYNGEPVSRIGEYSFVSKDLVSVVIPGSIKEIGEAAFADNKLTAIDIPNSVILIEGSAFSGNLLTTLTIPSSITEINEYAFQNNKLTSLNIPNSVIEIGWMAFAENNLTTITIPGSVVIIGYGAFTTNELKSVIISEGTTTIGDNAFNMNQITTVNIPNSVIEIGEAAFADNQISSIVIPENVSVLRDMAFTNNPITSARFLGPVPTGLGRYVFNFEGPIAIPTNSILVSSMHITEYRAWAEWMGLTRQHFYSN